MSYESQEQLRHDWINLQRIVKYLEGTVLNGDLLSHNVDRHAAWLNANKTQTTLKHAQTLFGKVRETQPSSSYNEVQTSLDRMLKITQDAKDELYIPPPRPKSLLASKGLPRPALPTASVNLEPDQDIPEAELLPSEDLMPPMARSREDPTSVYSPSPSQTVEPLHTKSELCLKVGSIPERPGFLTTSLETQEELAEQLAQMGHQLKLNALHLANSLAKEKGMIEGASEKLENNLGNMTKERVKLRDHSSKSGWTTWMWLGLQGLLMVVHSHGSQFWVCMPPIRLVLFDALFTLIRPRKPIAAQYAHVFSSHLGVVTRAAVEKSFPKALKDLKDSKPAYQGGKDAWWADVVRKTAIGAGADPIAVERSLPEILATLMETFRSKRGYSLYADVIMCLHALKSNGIHVGLVSNTDSRVRDVLKDLDVEKYFDVIILSEEEGTEKPSPLIWQRACERIKAPIGNIIAPSKEVLHIGDELHADYRGALSAGLDAVLLRRGGKEIPPITDPLATSLPLDLVDVRMMFNLQMVLNYVRQRSL
ncbi:hypothetical protein FRB98_000325 [Tulasnella sp. 332]|nr:hypothetical protein FRB98_000325 [Tulasnella sp. 332]